jgi:hypothetical protein
VSIKNKVRATYETVVGDVKIQHQRHRVRCVRKVGSQLNVMPTPAFSHLLRFHIVCCAEKFSELVNRPVVGLFGTRVSGKSTEMITKNI